MFSLRVAQTDDERQNVMYKPNPAPDPARGPDRIGAQRISRRGQARRAATHPGARAVTPELENRPKPDPGCIDRHPTLILEPAYSAGVDLTSYGTPRMRNLLWSIARNCPSESTT